VAYAYSLRWLANTSAVLNRFRHIVAVSPFVESYLRLRHRFRGEIRVIPNAIPPLPDTVQIPEAFPKTGRVTFGCYGNPGGLKNVGAALCAFLRVHEQLPDSRLLVFGGGWEKAGIQYAGLPVEFRGAQPHSVYLHQLGAEVDIWVHPSRIEAHPISICEAIQAGCPVIAGLTSGGVAWTIDYGQAGVLVDIEDPSEIAHAMLMLCNNRHQALGLVAHGRRMVAERFSPDRVVDMHLEYYRDIIAETVTRTNGSLLPASRPAPFHTYHDPPISAPCGIGRLGSST
jgi:glycosyltransferase involved in cell wall biosynthesis